MLCVKQTLCPRTIGEKAPSAAENHNGMSVCVNNYVNSAKGSVGYFLVSMGQMGLNEKRIRRLILLNQFYCMTSATNSHCIMCICVLSTCEGH